MAETGTRERWRRAGAIALASLALALLRLAHAGWLPALLGGAALAIFTAWRTVPGVWAGFAAFGAGAAVAWPEGAAGSLGSLAAALPWALALEGFGLLTILAVAWVRVPRRLSRRLLGSFLASTGIALLGVSLCAGAATGAAGSALVVGALAYRLGAVPAYAWLPMLLRHPRPAVKGMGAVGVLGAGALLALALPLLPDRAAGGWTLGVLSAATTPWAVTGAWRQRVTDPPCARTYVAVVAIALILLIAAVRLVR